MGRAPFGIRLLEIDVDAHADDFFACLREECPLLALEVSARGTGAYLVSVWRGRGKERH